MMIALPRPLAVLLLLTAVLTSSACGFRLAGTASMPDSLSLIKLNTSGFNEAQRTMLLNRLQQAGATLSAEPGAEVPVLTVRLGKLTEYSLFQTADTEQTKRLVQQMFYRVNDADGNLVLAERSLRQENSFEVDLYNIAASDREKIELQEQMLNALTSRMIYQLQRM